MRLKIEAAGWLISEYVDGGLFKASYFLVEADPSTPGAKLPSFMPMWQKVVCGLVGLLVLVAMFSPKGGDEQPVKTDKELYLSYYSNLMAKTAEADRIYEPFADSLDKGDIVGATQIALQIKSPITQAWGEISRIEAPDLKNQDAKKKLEQAKEAVSGVYLNKASMVGDFIDFAESQNVKKLAELKNTAENIQTLMFGGTAYLVEAGAMVGVKQDDVVKK